MELRGLGFEGLVFGFGVGVLGLGFRGYRGLGNVGFGAYSAFRL